VNIFNNLNDDGDMAKTNILAGICTFSSPYPIEKIWDSSYSYPYSVSAKIPGQNEDEFGQYSQDKFIYHL